MAIQAAQFDEQYTYHMNAAMDSKRRAEQSHAACRNIRLSMEVRLNTLFKKLAIAGAQTGWPPLQREVEAALEMLRQNSKVHDLMMLTSANNGGRSCIIDHLPVTAISSPNCHAEAVFV